MLAKLWKKVLLAVCIVACIFNIMSKLVNRHSLKENLDNANDGVTVFNIFQKDEIVETESKPIIDGVMNQEPVSEVINENDNKIIFDESVTSEVIDTEIEENTTEINNQEDNSTENTEESSEETKVFKFFDFTTLF